MTSHLDLEFTPGLRLDLHLPEGAEPPPVVVYLHGGAWRVGSRQDNPARQRSLTRHGFAVASVDYRLSGDAKYPAQLHDVTAAIAWIKDNGRQYGVDGSRIAVWGASAGAHLAAAVALTSAVPRAAVLWFPTTDLVRAAPRGPVEPRYMPSPEGDLLGLKSPLDDVEAARAASPRWLVHPDAPPFLIMHGDRDRLVPPTQSTVLHDALVDAGAASTLVVLGGAAHEDPAFDTPATVGMVAGFLTAVLKPG
ncbi:alpha/beta hydrolase [Paractinoplanes atraurantiacus]|uniref:Acetyl esterase/lipase n=1 Tax=Paractinoplanes atraurantiacus TaxID=1036182 RepID=A0A285JLU6_9ACTN|nr:alpha/beta hydrolase [Actinoplanes atraurantiacus]SNY61300.1 Acetyl esterase/lipase [Actinoplanes atraurantiacus]